MSDTGETLAEWYGMCGDCDWMGDKHPSYDQAQLDVDNHKAANPGHEASVFKG